jgi:hypothetical protein
MQEDRRQELMCLLEQSIEQERTKLSSHDLQNWLCQGVQEYFARWASFCTIEDFSIADLLESEFFGMLEIGSEFMERELSSNPPSRGASVAWADYLSALMALKRDKDRIAVERLGSSLAQFASTLGDADG